MITECYAWVNMPSVLLTRFKCWAKSSAILTNAFRRQPRANGSLSFQTLKRTPFPMRETQTPRADGVLLAPRKHPSSTKWTKAASIKLPLTNRYHRTWKMKRFVRLAVSPLIVH